MIARVHELSVAQSLIDVLVEKLASEHVAAVEAVFVSVGQLSGVEPAALKSAFHIAAGGTVVQGATLEIQDVPVKIWCARCNAERGVASIRDLRCVDCGQPSNDLRTGRELFIDRIRVRD
jgi:hydrogenase nickel incorporation protein HypA/HybF